MSTAGSTEVVRALHVRETCSMPHSSTEGQSDCFPPSPLHIYTVEQQQEQLPTALLIPITDSALDMQEKRRNWRVIGKTSKRLT